VVIPIGQQRGSRRPPGFLSDEATLEAIRRGLEDLAAGDAVPLEQVREDHAARRRS
jgi:predicted transcriptional regulator